MILIMVSESPLLTYKTEKRLVRDLSAHVKAGRGAIRLSKVAYEFGYTTGRTDLVGIGSSKALHAIEAKLAKWKDALDQARKNRCFAHYCYVALPQAAARTALSQKDAFRRFGVGLLVVNDTGAQLAIKPKRNAPLLPWVTKLAVATLANES